MLILTAGRFGQGLLLLSVIILPIWAVSLSTLGRSTGLPTTRDGSDYWILRYVDDQIETAIQQKLPPKERFQKWEEQLSDVELESFWRNRLSADDYLLPIDFLSIDPFKLELDPSDEGHPKLRFSSDLVLFSLFFLGPEKLGVFSSNLFPDSDITWTSGSKIIEDWGVFSDKALSSCHILSNYVLLTETSITESVWLHENCPVGPEKINLIANFAFLLTDYANANFEKPTHVKNNNLPSDTDVAPAVRSLSEILTSGTIPNTVTAVANLMDARPETAPSKPDYASLIMFSPRVYGLSQLIAKSIANELMIFFKAELSRRKMQPWTMDISRHTLA
ncbi:hypothetical protein CAUPRSCDRAFT_11859 [Caulochytrium protostelioides]|uniref:Uncharacterized protein n=1 Tax=Caulochytrium protostelioides TaxID=1555241 RepID=A0A4P9WY79_9FUNG|nr:hypothetical protein CAUPRSCDRAFT_11859 [Caulochytrium protostelioides]